MPTQFATASGSRQSTGLVTDAKVRTLYNVGATGAGSSAGRATVATSLPSGSFKDFGIWQISAVDPAISRFVDGNKGPNSPNLQDWRRFWIAATAPKEYKASGGRVLWPTAAFAATGLIWEGTTAGQAEYLDAVQFEQTSQGDPTPRPYQVAREIQIHMVPQRINQIPQASFEGPLDKWEPGYVRKNWLYNPSFETASTDTMVVRKNFILDPDCLSNSGWQAPVNGSGSVTGGRYVMTTPDGTRTSLSRATVLQYGLLIAGAQYTFTITANSTGLPVDAFVILTDSTGAPLRTLRTSRQTISTDTVFTLTFTPTAAEVGFSVGSSLFPVSGTLATGARLEQDAAMLVASSTATTFFSGSKTPAGDFQYAWLGAINASHSVETAYLPAGYKPTVKTSSGPSSAYQTSTGARTGTKALKVVKYAADAVVETTVTGLDPLSTYVWSAYVTTTATSMRTVAVNADGSLNGVQTTVTANTQTRIDRTFTTVAGETTKVLRIGYGATAVPDGTTFTVDDMLVEKGSGAPGTYLSGVQAKSSLTTSTTSQKYGTKSGMLTVTDVSSAGSLAKDYSVASTVDADAGHWIGSAWIYSPVTEKVLLRVTRKVDYVLQDGTPHDVYVTADAVAGQWTRYSAVLPLWTGSGTAHQVVLRAGFEGTGIAVNDFVLIDGVVLEKGTALLDYFDGTGTFAPGLLVDDYLWEGAAHDSRSLYYSGRRLKQYRVKSLIQEHLPVGASSKIVYTPN